MSRPGGRPPKPTRLKVLEGNPGKRPLAEEPKPPRGAVKAPAWLKGRGRRAWRDIAPVLEEMGLLTTADPHALALLCDAYGEYMDARKVLNDAESLTYTSETEHGTIVRPRPEVAIASDAWKRVLRMMTEFGMTPSARARVRGTPKEEIDPFEEFLSGRHEA